MLQLSDILSSYIPNYKLLAYFVALNEQSNMSSCASHCKYLIMCGSRKYPYPPTEGIGISRGVGGVNGPGKS